VRDAGSREAPPGRSAWRALSGRPYDRWAVARRVVVIGTTGLVVFVVGPALFERLAPRRWVTAYQRVFMSVYRPLAGLVPGWAVVETVGRRTGQPRQTPVGGRLRGDTFWLVVGDRSRSQYVKNIEANPMVRVRAHGRWHTGSARVSDDNAYRRLVTMNPINSLFIWIAGKDLATIRVDLAREPQRPDGGGSNGSTS
jgi:deazaflavin-dependent oxidoreductase (nitroreductase family)